jgi:hypothetical protein
MRCGMNEGLSIRNNEANVAELYTDGLVGCTQMILRNATGTFVAHIGVSAPQPAQFATWALAQFIDIYGAPTEGYVATGDGTGAVNAVLEALANVPGIRRLENSGGYTICPASGAVRAAPGEWHTGRQDVAGATTARGLVDVRFHSRTMLGVVWVGDYREGCRICG